MKRGISPRKIKEIRESLGLSTKEFADAIGVSTSTVCRYELGEIRPPFKRVEIIKQLAKAQNKEEGTEMVRTMTRDKINIDSTKLFSFLVPEFFNGIHKENDAAKKLGVPDAWLSELEKSNIKMVSYDTAKALYLLGVPPKSYVLYNAADVENKVLSMISKDVSTVPANPAKSVSSALPSSEEKSDAHNKGNFVSYKIHLQLQKEPKPVEIFECLKETFELFLEDKGCFDSPENNKAFLKEAKGGKKCRLVGKSSFIDIDATDEKGVFYSFIDFDKETRDVVHFYQFAFQDKKSLDVLFGMRTPIDKGFCGPIGSIRNIIWRFGAKDRTGVAFTNYCDRYKESDYGLFNENKPQALNSFRLIFPFSTDNTVASKIDYFAEALTGMVHVVAPYSPFVNDDISSREDIKAVRFPDKNEILFIGNGIKKTYSINTDNIWLANTILDTFFKTSSKEILESLPKLDVISPEEFKRVKDENESLSAVVSAQAKEIEDLKKKLSETQTELDAFVEDNGILSDKNKTLISELESAKAALSAKRAAMRVQDNKGSSSSTSFFTPEKDLYAGEINDIILKVLDKEVSQMQDPKIKKSRKYHVLSSIVINNVRTFEDERISDSLKSILSGGASLLDSSVVSQLEELGIEVDKSGTHPRLMFKGDPRYVHIASATSSDFRAGKNSAAEFSRMLFGY